MTLAVAEFTAPARLRRPIRRGWRSRYPGDFPTLGWGVLDWTHAYLPSPADEKLPLVYTDEQARRILQWYRLNPETGGFVNSRRMHLEEAKGYGKQPFAASIDLTEFAGPVCFDGWDADGQPVGVPWGTGARLDPWVQIGAVSEAQTRNTYSWVYAMLTANQNRAARDLRIDEGRTRLYLLDNPKAILEPVTAAALSREGQPVTHATLDEVQLWFESNGGHALVDNILGNLTKTGGRAVFTGNAYVTGEDSVAERFDVVEPGVLRYARRAKERPQRDWPRERLLAGLREVYGDAYWIDPERIVDDALAPTADWDGMVRKFWNLPSEGAANRWLSSTLWDSTTGDVNLLATEPTYAVVTIAHDHRTAAVAVAQLQSGKLMLTARAFPGETLVDGDYLPLDAVEEHLRDLRKRYPAFVLTVKRYHPKGREHHMPRHGPEFVYHGAFFEGSKQKLERDGLVFLDMPNTQERLAPAAEALKAAAIEGRLVHDGNAELGSQVAAVVAEEAAKGWSISQAGPAARAAMLAVHRAMTAPRPPSRRATGIH